MTLDFWGNNFAVKLKMCAIHPWISMNLPTLWFFSAISTASADIYDDIGISAVIDCAAGAR